jgi:uncharacterized protein (DUF697 family)/tellurite resistance protein
MQEREKEAMAAICLMAAVVDGGKSGVEHAKLKEIAQALDAQMSAAVVQRVLLRKTTLADEAAALSTPDIRMLAFEMAVCVCDADGVAAPEEQEFLNRLSDALSIPPVAALQTQSHAEDFAMAAAKEPSAQPPPPAPVSVPVCAPQTAWAAEPDPVDAQVDTVVLKHAILVGGLELLPQSLSTMAILPLQMKLVYNIGARYGYQLDSGHIKEFLAVLGVGMTSQIVEGFARRFLGSLAGRAGGHAMGHLSGAATGAAVTFAATYALGMAAKKYYSSGRTLSMADVKALFSKSTDEAKTLYSRYAGEVAQSAKSTNMSSLLSMVRNR